MQDPANGYKKETEFLNWINHHKRTYLSKDEYLYRRDIFLKNLEEIEAMNAENGEEIYGLNKFSDWTFEEFKRLNGLRTPPLNRSRENSTFEFENEDFKNEIYEPVNWHKRNKVTSVKD
jgi:hypothetical protein